MHSLVLTSAALVAAASAAAVPASDAHGGKNCHDILVPITVDATLKQFDYTPTDDEIDTTSFFLDFTRHGGDFATRIITSNNTKIHKDYTLAATLCHPPSGPSDTLQILTHGVGFDRSYWDFPLAGFNYSYVARALAAGHSTLSWDRLGIAASSHGDPVQEIQLPLEVAALHQLTLSAASSSSSPSRLCGTLPAGHAFSKTVHVGHSFGSALTYALAHQHPADSHAIVLTGFSHSPDYMALFALGADFAPLPSESLRMQYAGRPGYVAPRSAGGVHTGFFAPGDFSPDMLREATATRQPAALGELLTIADGAAAPSRFQGKVLVVTGERDVPFCGGDCGRAVPGRDAPDILQLSRPMFPDAAAFRTSIVPGAGHGLNFGYSHVETYSRILDFLKQEL